MSPPLRLETEGGIQRANCANTEGIFRIIQSIPSPKAEPFKRWLAQVGYERKELETKSGTPVVSRSNYLSAPEAEGGDVTTVSKTGAGDGGKVQGRKK